LLIYDHWLQSATLSCLQRLICSQNITTDYFVTIGYYLPSNRQAAHLDGRPNTRQKEQTRMYLVMGITGKVGGSTARHLLKQGKQVRAMVRNREKAAKWRDLGVELVDGDWNDATAIAAALNGVEGALLCCRRSGHPPLITEKQGA
jgi:hypothetical protein